MKNYIKSFQLLNFQSWSNTSPTVEIDSDIINIIEGANETGKSVLYKVFYNMCFPGYWKPKELIRRGYETACMILNLTNGSTVAYELSHKHHSYYLCNEEEDLSWTDCPLPERIIDELGLILDMESQVILNIIDKDVPLPFVKTAPRFNAGLIRAIVEPAKIADFFARTTDQLKDVDVARLKFKHQMETAREAAAVLQYRSVDKLQSDKLVVDSLLALTEIMVPLHNRVSAMLEVYAGKPKSVANPEVVADSVNIYNTLEAIADSVERYSLILGTRPAGMSSPANAEDLLSVYGCLSATLAGVTKTAELIANKPIGVQLPDVSNEIEISHMIVAMASAVSGLIETLANTAQLKEHMEVLQGEIEDIRDRVGVCPTCGRLLEG